MHCQSTKYRLSIVVSILWLIVVILLLTGASNSYWDFHDYAVPIFIFTSPIWLFWSAVWIWPSKFINIFDDDKKLFTRYSRGVKKKLIPSEKIKTEEVPQEEVFVKTEKWKFKAVLFITISLAFGTFILLISNMGDRNLAYQGGQIAGAAIAQMLFGIITAFVIKLFNWKSSLATFLKRAIIASMLLGILLSIGSVYNMINNENAPISKILLENLDSNSSIGQEENGTDKLVRRLHEVLGKSIEDLPNLEEFRTTLKNSKAREYTYNLLRGLDIYEGLPDYKTFEADLGFGVNSDLIDVEGNDKLKKLHKMLDENFDGIPEFDQFKQSMQNPNKRLKLWNTLNSSDKFEDLPDYKTFEVNLGF